MTTNTGKRFTKGVSGNPGGRVKGVERQLRELLGDDLPKIAMAMRDIALGKKPKGSKITIKAADTIKAAEWVYDRCFGRPKQSIDLGGDLTVEPRSTVDWSHVPIERRRELLAAATELVALESAGAGDGGPTEH